MTDAMKITMDTAADMHAVATPAPSYASRIGILDVTREYGINAVYERIAQLRAAGQHHAALAIEQELSRLGAAYPDTA
ncbi:hypothetical protein [Nocardia sp. BMG51109]|uniref:hypothetical protein n=1 Tax=Nocardia sp. BMG51109 TaxID=1056816 RepID=UPI0004B09EF5|nr:hypothetical protein [Nocardia sp. BMG51109]